MSCPRNFTREQIVEGLKAGRTLMVDRSDAPELEDIIDLKNEGLVTTELIEIDTQSTALKVRWKT